MYFLLSEVVQSSHVVLLNFFIGTRLDNNVYC